MIKGILFAVFFVLMAVAIGISIWGGVRLYRDYYNEEDKKRKGLLFSGITGFLVTLGLVIFIPGSFHQVEAGSVAVVKELGKIVDIRTPGTYYDFYMTRKYEVYDTTVQQVQIKTATYSNDAQTMNLELYLQYQIQLNKLIIKDEKGNIIQNEGIAGKYVTLDSLQDRIVTQCKDITKSIMGDDHFYDPLNVYTDEEEYIDEKGHLVKPGDLIDSDGNWTLVGIYPANDFAMKGEEIIKHRGDVSKKVSKVVREAIDSDFYVTIHDVVLTNIDFTDEFEKSVEDKVIAEQQKQAAITRAEADLEVARIEAQKKIEEARGNAEAQKILAQATAEAATYKIIELARVIGYEVKETYLYSVNDVETEFDTKQAETETCIYLGTKYVIDITTGPGAAQFKTLVEDYLQYLAYLEQWDGQLPNVVAGDDALSIIVPNA